MSVDEIVLSGVFDAHVHLRQDAYLPDAVRYTAKSCASAVVMPNLSPPIWTVAEAKNYAAQIQAIAPEFEPVVALYLGAKTTTSIVEDAGSGARFKLYPSGVTTNSEAGAQLDELDEVLSAMESKDILLLVHGEDPDPESDIFEREKRFIDRYMVKLLRRHPKLRICFEHITTADAVALVKAEPNLGATITPQHLLFNRNALFAGNKIRPHHFCLPILKTEPDRVALVEAATGGDPSFFMGTDSAPHTKETKECSAGCAGIFSAPIALSLYAQVFDAAGQLPALTGFCCEFGPRFHRHQPPEKKIRLVRKEYEVPAELPFYSYSVVPLFAGQSVPFTAQP